LMKDRATMKFIPAGERNRRSLLQQDTVLGSMLTIPQPGYPSDPLLGTWRVTSDPETGIETIFVK
jgi:hypothetical protein